MKPTIVMRAHNDMPLVERSLDMVWRQDHPFELVVLDNDSTDGTLDMVSQYTDRIVNIPAGEYVPGRVLNLGMQLARSEIVVFLNADCEPVNESWLRELVTKFDDHQTAAVFGRQLPRAGCWPLYAMDTEATFGDGSRQRRWRHCFSMASAAIRRSAWEDEPFDENLQYSEDIHWTWNARRRGLHVIYAPDSVALHSHNYTLPQYFRRHRGEGAAEATIFAWTRWERSLLRYSVLPFGRQVLGDWAWCWRHRSAKWAISSPWLRLGATLVRRMGFRRTLREAL